MNPRLYGRGLRLIEQMPSSTLEIDFPQPRSQILDNARAARITLTNKQPLQP